jgi:hypothetical protein
MAMDSDAGDDMDFMDEYYFGEAAAEYSRQFSAQAAAENAAARRRRPAQRGRSTGRGTTAGRRGAASDPGQARTRRRRTAPADGPSVAGSTRGRGATTSSAAASADGGQPAEEPQATADDFWEFQQEMQAEAARVRELEAELAAEAAAEEPTGERSRWGQRCDEEEGRWRTSAPIIGAAVLQLHAAPEPGVPCCSCQAPGCTIRYVGLKGLQIELLRHKLVPCPDLQAVFPLLSGCQLVRSCTDARDAVAVTLCPCGASVGALPVALPRVLRSCVRLATSCSTTTCTCTHARSIATAAGRTCLELTPLMVRLWPLCSAYIHIGTMERHRVAPTCSLPAGFFMFRPTLCNKCHGTDITGTVVKTQALDYITTGEP